MVRQFSGGGIRRLLAIATPAVRLQRWAEVEEIVQSSAVRDNLVGTGPAWLRVLRQIVEVARFTDCSILMTGDSGRG